MERTIYPWRTHFVLDLNKRLCAVKPGVGFCKGGSKALWLYVRYDAILSLCRARHAWNVDKITTNAAVITFSFIRAHSSVQPKTKKKVISTSKIALRKARRCSYHIIELALTESHFRWVGGGGGDRNEVKLILVVLFRCITNINQNNRNWSKQTTAF